MASYAEYPTTMGAHDFELYPTNDEFQNLMATSQSYMNNGFLDSTFSTFDSPSNLQCFSGMPQQTFTQFDFNVAQNMKHTFQTQTPGGSPHSATQSFDMQPPHLSNSSESGASVSSSAMGSPSITQTQAHESWNPLEQLASKESFYRDNFMATNMDFNGTVDPTLIQPMPSPVPFAAGSPFSELHQTPHFPFIEQPPSPAPSQGSVNSQYIGSRRFKSPSVQSPRSHNSSFQPYPSYNGSRRPSVSSIHSRQSAHSRRSGSSELDDESREKGTCPYPDCGRVFKDLKAHILTHQKERPEKCPIVTCEYNQKGFARRYDKNRHTLTHYKGTMVCGFCPGSGSAAEKSFNRADVFKRHLTSVHGVEQNPPNSRKKPSAGSKKPSNVQDVPGTCSTCSLTFPNAQEFYEHLDDCVLRVVQQADPSEAINQKLLCSMAEDNDVKETLERHCLPTSIDDFNGPQDYEHDDEEEEEEEDDEDVASGVRNGRSGKGSIKSKKDNQH